MPCQKEREPLFESNWIEFTKRNKTVTSFMMTSRRSHCNVTFQIFKETKQHSTAKPKTKLVEKKIISFHSSSSSDWMDILRRFAATGGDEERFTLKFVMCTTAPRNRPSKFLWFWNTVCNVAVAVLLLFIVVDY